MQTNETLIKDIIKKETDFLLRKKNVIGVGLGNKFTNGTDTGEKCIHVFVEKKVDKNTLLVNDLIEKSFHGVKTDVIETGIIEAQEFTSRVRPLRYGYSVGPYNLNLAGTAGCLVSDGRRFFILSNNHVLAYTNTLRRGTPILQPARLDGGRYSRDYIASLYSYVPISFINSTTTPINEVDAAIAYIRDTRLTTAYIERVGYVRGISDPILGMQVKKSGRSSELTFGNILSTNATIYVQYSYNRIALFENQILTTNMSIPGDSGSLVLDNNNNAVGLLFAGSSSITVINPILPVLRSLNVGIVVVK